MTSPIDASDVEKAFAQCLQFVGKNIVIDRISVVPEPPGYVIQTHDQFGVLPRTFVRDEGERQKTIESVEREAAKLVAIARIRQEIGRRLTGCRFLFSLSSPDEAIVGVAGLHCSPVFGAGQDDLAAYRSLWKKMKGERP